MDISGGCLCRQVRFSIGAAPIVTRACWCRVCQYIGAGSGTVNVCFPSAALTVTGELRDYSLVADSGTLMHRRFCPTCGTHLFSAAQARPHLIFVRAGALDDPELAQPAHDHLDLGGTELGVLQRGTAAAGAAAAARRLARDPAPTSVRVPGAAAARSSGGV